jgi:hypothetical protein
MKPEELLTQTRNGLHIVHESHFAAAKHYERLGQLLGGGATAVAAVIGTTALQGIVGGSSQTLQLAIGIGGLLAAALASLQTYLNYPSLAERHRAAAQRYGVLRRDAERLAAFAQPGVSQEDLAGLHARWDEADQAAPTIPSRIISRSPHRIARLRKRISAATGAALPAQSAHNQH